MEPSGEKYSFTMAYSKELEAVIEAALADGVLTDKERAVLHKKAQREGIDPDELDVVIEGRLAKMKREEDWLRPTPPPTTEKRGNIVKCPNCGAPIMAGAVKCEDCGYVFTNVSANRSAEKLALLIQLKSDEFTGTIASASNENNGKQAIMNQRDQEISTIIANFPIPTGKEELMEFIASMDAKRKEQGPLQQAYRAKFNECIIKAKTFFGSDPQVMNMVKAADKFSISALTKMQKIVAACIIGAIILCIWGMSSADKMSETVKHNAEIAERKAQIAEQKAQMEAQMEAQKKQNAQNICDSLCALIDGLPTPTYKNCEDVARKLLNITWTLPVDDGKVGYNDLEQIKNSFVDKKRQFAGLIESAYETLWRSEEYKRNSHSIGTRYRNKITGEVAEHRPIPSEIDSPNLYIYN